MKKLIPVFFFIFLLSDSYALKYYWVGGSGSWSQYTTHWATSSGGATFHVQVPRSVDSVYFDANSFTGNAQTVTIDATSVCADMDWTGATTTYTGTVNGPTMLINATLEIWGSFKVVSGMREIKFAYDVSMLFKSLSTGKTITTEGTGFGSTSIYYDRFYINFTSTAGGWTISDSLITDGNIILTGGSLNTNSKVVKCARIDAGGSTSRTLTLGSSVITCYGSPNMGGNVWSAVNTGLTFSGASSTLKFVPNATSTSCSFTSVGLTYGRIISYMPINFYNYASGANTYADMYLYKNSTMGISSMTFTDSLYLAPGGTYVFSEGYNGSHYTYYFGASGKLVANGTCGKPVTVITDVITGATPFNRTGGWAANPAVSYCNFEGINCTGGGSLTATNTIDLGRNTNITITSPAAKTLYWIGNGGYWHDGTHWSLTSGGAASGCIPTAIDTVYFDANSFSSASQVVTVDTVSAYFNKMSWVGVTNTPKFKTVAGNSMNVYGHLTFVAGMTSELVATTYFKTTATSNITSAGQYFRSGTVNFTGTGTYNFMDAFVSYGTGAYVHYYTGAVFLYQGTLNTNNNNFTTRIFVSTGSLTRAVNLGSSAVLINSMDDNWTVWNWNCSGSNISVNSGTSVITIDNGTYGQPVYFVGGGFTYYDIIFNDVEVNANIDNFTAHTMICYGGGIFTNNNTITNLLQLTGAKTYTFEKSKTTTFSGTALLSANGGCNGLIIVSSSLAGTQHTFICNAGPITADNISLQDMNGSGTSTYTASTALDLGNNTNWVFSSGTARTLYWVGGSGNWSDQNHWATSSNGTPGNCPPSLIDDCIFDNSSFSSGNRTVTVDVNDAYCKNMTWTNTLHSPVFTSTTKNLRIYGSLTFHSSMTNNFTGSFYFKGSGANTINMAGKSFSMYTNIYIDCGAANSYSLSGAITAAWACNLNILSGTFNTNNYNIQITSIASNGTATRTINLGSSKLYIYTWAVTSSVTLNCGTSIMYFQAGWTNGLTGGGKVYNKVLSSTEVMGIADNNTFNVVTFTAHAYVYGNNLIKDSLNLTSNMNYYFGSGATTTFTDTCYIDVVGLPSNPIHMYRYGGSGASQFTWTKTNGRVCSDYIYMENMLVTGGADWQAGTNADTASNVDGWAYSPYSVKESVTIGPASSSVCPGTAVNLVFDFSKGPGIYPQNYPKELVVDISTGGGPAVRDTIYATTDPYNYPLTTDSSRTFLLIKSSKDGCFASPDTLSSFNSSVAVYSGTAGSWAGRTSNDWFLCSNWENGVVPTSTTDVTISTGVSNMPVIAAAGAVCRNIKINNGASLSMTNVASSLDLYGCLRNHGAFTAALGTVTMRGSSTTYIAGVNATTFNNLTINNSNGVRDSNNVTVNGVLTITSGKFELYDKTLTLAGTISCTDSILGSNSSVLNITGSGALGTIKFSTANRNVGTLTMNRTSSGTMTLGTPVSVVSSVNFTDGYIVSSLTNYIEFTAGSGWSNASNSSFVSGPVRKTGNTAFTFPVGKNGEYHLCAISAPSLVTEQFLAEYFEADPVAAFGTNMAPTINHVSTCEYWDIDRLSGATDVIVTLSWTPQSCNMWAGVTSPADLVVAHWYDTATDIWEDLGASGYTGGNSSGTVTASLISSSYSPFALASKTAANPLPIELLKFDAKRNGGNVDLRWITAAEINNDYFTVERSSDSQNFEGVTKVNGAGNSAVVHEYNAVDFMPLKGVSYYRLKQTDYDGKYTYSQIVPVNFLSNALFDLGVYPNPSNGRDNITMQLNGLSDHSDVLVVIRDVLGKEYYSKVIMGGETDIQFVIESSEPLAKGIYIISASSNDKLISKKLIVE